MTILVLQYLHKAHRKHDLKYTGSDILVINTYLCYLSLFSHFYVLQLEQHYISIYGVCKENNTSVMKNIDTVLELNIGWIHNSSFYNTVTG